MTRDGGKRGKESPMSEVPKSVEELFDDGHAIDEALALAAKDARRLHKALDNPTATGRNPKRSRSRRMAIHHLPPCSQKQTPRSR